MATILVSIIFINLRRIKMGFDLIIINSKEFRSNQSKYLIMVAKGEDVILKTRSLGSFKITPVTKDDALVSKAEMMKKIEEARKDILSGKGKNLSSAEELSSFLKSL